jgi:hypothetical protein
MLLKLLDLIIEKKEIDFEKMGLKASSVIKLHRLLTASDIIIEKTIGVLPPSYHSKVYEKLKLLFKLI